MFSRSNTNPVTVVAVVGNGNSFPTCVVGETRGRQNEWTNGRSRGILDPRIREFVVLLGYRRNCGNMQRHSTKPVERWARAGHRRQTNTWITRPSSNKKKKGGSKMEIYMTVWYNLFTTFATCSMLGLVYVTGILLEYKLMKTITTIPLLLWVLVACLKIRKKMEKNSSRSPLQLLSILKKWRKFCSSVDMRDTPEIKRIRTRKKQRFWIAGWFLHPM